MGLRSRIQQNRQNRQARRVTRQSNRSTNRRIRQARRSQRRVQRRTYIRSKFKEYLVDDPKKIGHLIEQIPHRIEDGLATIAGLTAAGTYAYGTLRGLPTAAKGLEEEVIEFLEPIESMLSGTLEGLHGLMQGPMFAPEAAAIDEIFATSTILSQLTSLTSVVPDYLAYTTPYAADIASDLLMGLAIL